MLRARSIAAALALALGTTAPATAAGQPVGVPPARVLVCSGDSYSCVSKAYRAGDLVAARAGVDALLNALPDDADALLLSGLIALRQDDLPAARIALDHAARVAPTYADVFVARARLNLREGRLEAAQQDISRVSVLAPDHPDAAALSSGLASLDAGSDAPATATWTGAIDNSVSRLSPRAANAWYETQVTIARRQGRSSIALEVEHARRFGRSDVRFQLQADHRVGNGSIYVAAVTTRAPDFRESWGLRTGGFYPVSRRVDVLIDARFSNYGPVNSGSVTTAIRGWSAKRRGAVRLSLINFIDETGSYRAGWATDLSQLISSRMRVQAGYARYPETEGGVTRRVNSAFLGGAYEATDSLSFRLGVAHESRQGAYRRASATIGVSVGL